MERLPRRDPDGHPACQGRWKVRGRVAGTLESILQLLQGIERKAEACEELSPVQVSPLVAQGFILCHGEGSQGELREWREPGLSKGKEKINKVRPSHSRWMSCVICSSINSGSNIDLLGDKL